MPIVVKLRALIQKALQAMRDKKAHLLLEKRRAAFSKQRNDIKKQNKYYKALERNPYLQSKALWNDMYGDIQHKLENSYRIIFVLSAVIFIAIIGFVIVSNETKIKPLPFIVHGNEVLTVDNSHSQSFSSIKPKVALYFAKNFIRYSRSVSVDGDVNAHNKIAAFSFVTNGALATLKSYYQKNDTNTIAQHYVKSIHITSVLRLSTHTLDIRWKEIWRSINTGELIKSRDYIAQITYRYTTPSENAAILRNNPLGFDIQQLSWSEDNDH